MSPHNDNENPFAYNTENARTGGDGPFHDYENPFATLGTEPTTTTQAAGAGKALTTGRLIKLYRWNTGLRVATFLFTFLAVLLIFLSKQTSDVTVGKSNEQIPVTAIYKYNSAFQFFLYVNIEVSAYALLFSCLAFLMGRKGTGEATPSSMMWIFFALNMVQTAFLLLAFAAALAVEVVARKGMTLTGNDLYVKWNGMCNDFGRFCTVVESAFGASILGYCCLAVGTGIDAYFIHRRKVQNA